MPVPRFGRKSLQGNNGARSNIQTLKWINQFAWLAVSNRDLDAVGLMDTPRPTARETLEKLRALGITRTIMITGDNRTVAEAVVKEVGLDETWGDLMLEGTVERQAGLGVRRGTYPGTFRM